MNSTKVYSVVQAHGRGQALVILQTVDFGLSCALTQILRRLEDRR